MKKLIGYGLLALLSVSLVTIEVSENLHLLAIKTGSIAAVSLWFWMLIDAIQNDCLVRKKDWIVMLVLFNWITAIFYFFLIYRKKPAESKEVNPLKTLENGK